MLMLKEHLRLADMKPFRTSDSRGASCSKVVYPYAPELMLVADHVQRGAAAPERIDAPWSAACEGVISPVRERLLDGGSGYEGSGYELRWMSWMPVIPSCCPLPTAPISDSRGKVPGGPC